MTDTHKNIKDTYNTLVGEKLDGKYEYDRWFKTPLLSQGYAMTKFAITQHVLPYIPDTTQTVLELGPGPGTWTKELLKKIPDAQFDLVDISREMLVAAEKSLQDSSQSIEYIETDFLDFAVTKQYDVFFSSRAIEYITDKGSAIAKIVQSVRSGGRGFLITKTPHYGRQQLLGKAVSDMHKNQISPSELKQLFQNNGCVDVRVYPVGMSCYYSLFKSLQLNHILHVLFRNMQLNTVSQHFSESYLISFTKQ